MSRRNTQIYERRVKQSQMKILLDLLSEEGLLVNGRLMNNDKNKRQNFWKRVAMQLNAVEGGVKKTTWKWSKMFSDWKTYAKKKADILLSRSCSLEQPTPALSKLEWRLLKMINYPMDDMAATQRLEMIVDRAETPENIKSPVVFMNVECDESQAIDDSYSDDDKTAVDSCDALKTEICEDYISQGEDNFEDQETSDMEVGLKMKGKVLKRKKQLSLEEYKYRTKLNIEKEKVKQKSEELKLRALELRLKGDELRLKRIEMNKMNYLTNIEEKKLKYFKDISSSLKELLDRTRSGTLKFHDGH